MGARGCMEFLEIRSSDVFGLSQGHDPGHSDVHGQKLCDAVQEGGVHTSIAADATSVPLQPLRSCRSMGMS